MDPISLALGAVGLGMQIFGGMASAENAQAQASVSADEAQQEQGINAQKQQAMEIDARRRSLEQVRQSQQAQALAVGRATNQNAQFGTGLQGGLDEITGQSTFNLQGINSSLEIGRNINKYNQNISSDKVQMANLGGQEATDKGIMSLGGSLLGAGPTIGKLSQGMGLGGNGGGWGLGNIFMGGGSPSGL